MRNTRIAALAGLMAISFLAQGRAATAKADDKVVREIKVLRDKWIEAEESRDVPYLEQLFADDVVVGNSQGQVLDKAQFLERVKNPERTLKVLNPRDIQTRVYGSTVIWAEHVTVEGQDKGHPFGGEFRFIRIFAKIGGKWQVVLAQGTPLPAATK